MLGEEAADASFLPASDEKQSDQAEDTITELICAVDDMTGEEISFALRHFLEAGALDAYAAPVIMKKSRPGFQLTILVHPEDQKKMKQEIFRHTTTLGIRCHSCTRAILNRTVTEASTDWGTIRMKESKGYGCRKMKIEYDDLAAAAMQSGLSLQEIRDSILQTLCEKEVFQKTDHEF